MLAPFPSPYPSALLGMCLLGISAHTHPPLPLEVCRIGVGIGRALSRTIPSSLDLPLFSIKTCGGSYLLLSLPPVQLLVFGSLQECRQNIPAVCRNSTSSYHYTLPTRPSFLHPQSLPLALHRMIGSRSCSRWCWNEGKVGRFDWSTLEFLRLPLWYFLSSGFPKVHQLWGWCQ